MGTHTGVINMMSDSEYVKLADEAWKEEKNDKNTGDVVESRKNSAGRKIYRCKAKIEMPAKLLIEAISNTDKVCEWNATLTEARVLKTINKDCVISYQVTSEGGGGMVSARDFVYVSKKGYDGREFVMGGMSVEYKDAPAQGKIVRAHNGPGCQMVIPTSDSQVCDFLWLMDCDYKGWMPQSILDA